MAGNDGAADLALTAFRVGGASMRLATAPVGRTWMTATDRRYAYRCLPLLIANQAGWLLLNPVAVRVTWTGERATEALRIEPMGTMAEAAVSSHFGHGIVTWTIPYLFRTPPGYNLLVRGPANWPKDGVSPLEGIVEADWTASTFTMNWMITRPDHAVVFEVDEPICMLVPQRRGELEAFRPETRDIASDPDLRAKHEAWCRNRAGFLRELQVPGSPASQEGWQKHYFGGVSPSDGTPAPEHQTRLQLREFEPRDPGSSGPGGEISGSTGCRTA